MSTDTLETERDHLAHIRRVRELMLLFMDQLLKRAFAHDESKLHEPELSGFAEAPDLSDMEYGSEEYQEALEQLKPVLEHHYDHNDHHPEHFEEGIRGMDLFQVTEMFADWIAAVERHDDENDIYDSIKVNVDRFDMDHDLAYVLANTAKTIGIPKNGSSD